MIKRYTLHDLRYIFIGRVGERNALTVDIDVSGWLSMFPDGDLELRLSLPDGSVFVPDIERTSDGHLLWIVGETETSEAGNIAAQLVLLSDGVIAMTFVFECDVLPSGVPVRPVTHVTPPITDIRLTDSDGLVDYYAITCADGSVFEFSVTNGAAPAVDINPVEGGYRLSVTDKRGTRSVDLRPNFVLAGAIQQKITDSEANVPSCKAVKDAIEAGGGGWTKEQVDLLETVLNHLVYDDATTGQTAAISLVASLRSVAKTLSGISAVYTGGIVAAGTTIDQLTGITVTAIYSDKTTEEVTDYVLSGVLTAGQTNTITVTYEGYTATFSVPVAEQGKTLYAVTYDLTNCSSSNTAATVEEGEPFVAVVAANTGYNLVGITVTMGGTDITDTALSDNTVSISSVTGAIVITASATISSYSITRNLTNCFSSQSNEQVTHGLSQSETITANTGYTLDSVTCTMGGQNITVTDGVISIDSVTGDIVITATATRHDDITQSGSVLTIKGLVNTPTQSGSVLSIT